MAKYIITILKTQLIIVWSWGFNNPVALNNGLRFRVKGYKFRGVVDVIYNEGSDLFDLRFLKANKVVNTIDGIFFDTLIDTIDEFVERTQDYDKRVTKEYLFNNI